MRDGSKSDRALREAYRVLLLGSVLVALVVLGRALVAQQLAFQSKLSSDALSIRINLLVGCLTALSVLILGALALRLLRPGSLILVGIALFEDTVRLLYARDVGRILRSSPCIAGTASASKASSATSRLVVLLDKVIKILVLVVHSYGCW
jgi:hypothetical protein